MKDNLVHRSHHARADQRSSTPRHGELRGPLAQVRRAEHHQQTAINWLLSSDHSPLETTIAYEQVAIEVTAAR